MLKRFLKFFKPHDDEDMPHFEGSYLDFVLEQSKPGVIEELEACPEHDPLLLIIAEILRVSMEGIWSTTLRRPLIDQHSPLHRPTQAPPPPPPSDADATGEFEPLVLDDEGDPASSSAPRDAQLDEDDDEPTAESDLDGLAPSDEDADAPDEATAKSGEDEDGQQESEAEDHEDASAEVDDAEGPDDEAADDEPEASAVDEDAEEEESEATDDARDALDEEPERAPEDVSDDSSPEESGEDEDAQEESEGEAQEGAEEDGREDVLDGQDEAEILDEAMILEEDDITETNDHFPPPLPDGRHTEDTAQFDAVSVEEELAKEEDDLGEDGLPRVDKPEVLQAGRVYLGMLIENDRLPVDLHLGIEETLLARDLLVGYFVGHQDFETKAQKLLRIVEQKFGEGQFSQARILLQLFQTDRDTRIRNDRNIFYEDMIQRLGIRRRHPVSEALLQEFKELARPDALDDHVDPIELLTWLEAHLFIKMNVFVRQPGQVTEWLEIGRTSSLPGAAENLLRYLPPRRWRSATTQHGELDQLITEHVNGETLSLYVINLMRTCYFVLRAVGDTGLEGFLDTFFDWAERNFGVNATLFLPELYRRSMGDVDAMKVIFQELYNRHFREAAEAFIDQIEEDVLMEAMNRALDDIRSCDINDIPPGSYDFGGFVFDRLFTIEYPTEEFPFKLHRLT